MVKPNCHFVASSSCKDGAGEGAVAGFVPALGEVRDFRATGMALHSKPVRGDSDCIEFSDISSAEPKIEFGSVGNNANSCAWNNACLDAHLQPASRKEMRK